MHLQPINTNLRFLVSGQSWPVLCPRLMHFDWVVDSPLQSHAGHSLYRSLSHSTVGLGQIWFYYCLYQTCTAYVLFPSSLFRGQTTPLRGEIHCINDNWDSLVEICTWMSLCCFMILLNLTRLLETTNLRSGSGSSSAISLLDVAFPTHTHIFK